jgi:hypothetical protein
MSEIKTKNVQVFVKDLDLVNYEDALQIQEQYFNEGTAIKLEQKNIFSAAQPLNYLFLCRTSARLYTWKKRF